MSRAQADRNTEGGLEINPTLRRHAQQRFPSATIGSDLRKYEKDLRKGRIAPIQSDIIEGSVTCHSRTTLRWVQQPAKK